MGNSRELAVTVHTIVYQGLIFGQKKTNRGHIGHGSSLGKQLMNVEACYTATTSSSGSTSLRRICWMAYSVPEMELGQLPQAP